MSVRDEADKTVPSMPLFYRAPRPVDIVRHARKSVSWGGDFAFARATSAVPLNTIEFVEAVRHYPIVFSLEEPTMPMVVVGIRPDLNLFVDAGGNWLRDSYIPAYVRRYPFILIDIPDSRFALGVDEAASSLGDTADHPLFVDGKPSPLAEEALKFCMAFQSELNVTRQFCEELAKQDLLIDQSAHFDFKGGQQVTLQGFRIVDQAKLRALPDAVFLRWRNKGYLALVYCHLFSMKSWENVLNLASQRNATREMGSPASG